MKPFFEALKDGYKHITEITDRDLLRKYRNEGIRIDEEGFYSYSFGDHREFEQRIEPVGEEGSYYIAIYKNSVLINEKLLVWTKENK